MRPLLFRFDSAEGLAERLRAALGADSGDLERRHFPDGESYVRLLTPVKGRHVVLLCSLDRPESKALPLLFAADAARAQGARSVGLVAPYLAYMRQDAAFRPGEAVTSLSFARLLSGCFDWLATIDPHLHRHSTLADLYSIPAAAASAAEPIARWIGSNVERPFLVGPDEESRQWVERIATLAEAPFAVLRKLRNGDSDVRVGGMDAAVPDTATPVIVDDIASTAATMIETIRLLDPLVPRAPICILVHAIFAGDAHERLLASGPSAVVTTNAVAHASNAIDVSAELAAAVAGVAPF